MDQFCRAIIVGNIEKVKLYLKDKQFSDDRIIPFLKWAIIWSVGNNEPEIVKLILADDRINPTKEDGIRLEFVGSIFEIVIIDNVVCYVQDDKVEAIEDEATREKFVKWQYRIGGEKWSQAKQKLN